MCKNMQNVSSLNIKSVGYDMDRKILYIKFLNGSLYIYKGVPLIKYEELRKIKGSSDNDNLLTI